MGRQRDHAGAPGILGLRARGGGGDGGGEGGEGAGQPGAARCGARAVAAAAAGRGGGSCRGLSEASRGRPRTPGACPDLDLDKFLTFAHREAYWTALRQEVELIRKAAPNVKLMQMLHPAMEAVYKPLQDRWPIAAQAILTSAGKVFESAQYSRAWLGDYGDKDWGVLYYVPRPGSAYLEIIMGEATRALDEVGLDGLYCDEFSWAFTRNTYSRYDYSRWDGYSADLDEAGNVVHLKADGAAVTESCQLRMAGEVLRRGKYFLGNGGSALRSVNRLPIARFIEGGNGTAQWPQGHLSATPLILGNMGDERTRQGVFASVKACLREGCLYSPTPVNLLLDGRDNFVCKLYPMTVQRIGPGWVVGEGADRDDGLGQVSVARPDGAAICLRQRRARCLIRRPSSRQPARARSRFRYHRKDW